MGKFTDAIVASGKTISAEARSLLEHFEAIQTGISDSDKAEMKNMVCDVRELIEANVKDLGEHKETLLALAGKVDAQVKAIVDAKMIGIAGHIKASLTPEKISEIQTAIKSKSGEVRMPIMAAAADPVVNDPNYPSDIYPLRERVPGIGRMPFLMSTFYDDVTKSRRGADARTFLFLDQTPFEGDANWWERKDNSGNWKKKDDVSWGYVDTTVPINVIAELTRVNKFDLVDIDWLEQEIRTTLEKLLTRGIRKAILAGNPATVAGSPTGAMTLAVAYNFPDAAGTVAFANVADALSKMAAQIRTAGYEGQIVAYVSPAALAELQTLKAENGTYLDWSKALAGVILKEDMTLTGMQALVCIPEMYHVVLFGGPEIVFIVGSVKNQAGEVIGTTPEFNQVEIRAEQRIATYVFTNERPAFVKGELDAIVADINKGTAITPDA